jgi:signal transduction histidine kinase
MTEREPTPPRPGDCFTGGGELGELMRAFDWSRTPLGPVARWPQSLRTSLNICLTSRFPIVIFWGPELTLLYNDAYAAILADKHPRSLGSPTRLVFSEVMHIIEPMLRGVMRSGQATWSHDELFMLDRHGYAEECYFRFSYSPMLVESGGVGGIFCAVTETTQEVVTKRRLQTLEQLAARASEAKTPEEAYYGAAVVLHGNRCDVPFAGFYCSDPTRLLADRIASAGEPPDAMPCSLALTERGELAHPDQASGADPGRSLVLPLRIPGEPRPTGFIVAGVNPQRPLDDEHRSFFTFVVGHVCAAIANAKAFEAARERAEVLAELDRAKTTFFSNISHELRTPLTLMLGHTEDALASPAGALYGDALASVHRNQLRLLKLVNTLLEFSRIEAGRAQAHYEPTDLAALTIDLASAFRAAIERGGMRFDVDCPPLPEPVHVDREMWEKIVLNLLSNAFKFTFDGTIRVALRPIGEHVALEVSDTGVGIPEAEIPRMFERFHRIEGSRARTHEGSGIGLALVHELVRLHGGSIHVESRQGHGTTFTVVLRVGVEHLPRERIGAGRALPSTAAQAEPYVAEALRWLPEPAGAVPPLEPETLADEPSRPRGDARVLVADDNADMRDYLVRLLEQEGFTVEAVADGAQALAAATTRRHDLVLADVMMPNLDGLGLLHRLRADPRTRTLRVILLSARAGEESRIEGLRAGADDYLVKPFSAKELVARVVTHLERSRLHRAAHEQMNELRAAAEVANRAKDEFLAMLGHELRNPLAPISTVLHLMRQRGGVALEREQAVLERQVGQMVRLVDDLLDVSRIIQGKIELDRAHIEVSEIVARALETASPLLEQREHRLTVSVAHAGLRVDGDLGRLAQVVSNLLTNAAKYTERGGRITVAAERSDAEIVIRVTDDGIGIARELLPRVFEMFVQERQALDRSQGGLGLGLAIVRSLVVLHGGSITAHSEGEGQGSEITVRLPATEQHPTA